MSKRCSAHARRDRDLYLTPPEPVAELQPHLPGGTRFIEPCAAEGGLARKLEAHGHHCVFASDIVPLAPHVRSADATSIDFSDIGVAADLVITNTPWLRPLLHAMIENLSAQLPTWLLFDADWKHTRQARRFLPHCGRIVSVGRVRWISESKSTGKDNAAWYLFAPGIGPPVFYGRGQPAAPAILPGRNSAASPHLHREPAR